MKLIKNIFQSKLFVLIVLLFIGMIIWRASLFYFDVDKEGVHVQIWAASYQIVAWCGAIIGLIFSKYWGGTKSLLGKLAIAFSLGLLLQSFGQSVFSYYFYTGTEAPYPSVADIGFFGSIPFYIYGVTLLARVSGVKVSMKSMTNKIGAFIIPSFLLGLSYIVFLRDYQFELAQTLKIFLDFGYPLGQAIYISIAILAFVLSRNILGGLMRKAILFFIVALVAQYVSDYAFLFQSSRGTFTGGGLVDLMYLVSYFLMSLSLIELGLVFGRIKNS